MSNEQNDQMSDLLDIDAALDDDEIVDLLEVVKPGKSSGAKDSGDEDIDFSADLDAMLEKLESAERALDAQDNAAPFPDPTPVDHAVDPDETLDMPSMDDLNNLLETLGASADAPEAKDAAGGMPNLSADLDATPIMEQPPAADGEAAGLPDLDELLAQADAADGAPAAPSANAPAMDTSDLNALVGEVPTVVEPAPVEDVPVVPMDLDDLPIAAAPTAPAKPAAPIVDGQPDLDALLEAESPAPVSEAAIEKMTASDIPDIAAEEASPAVPLEETADRPELPVEDIMPASENLPEPLPEEPVPAAQSRPSDAEALAVVAEAAGDLPVETGLAQPSTAPRYDEVDLNELDALLDDMLASAPASGPAPAAEPQRAAAPQAREGNLAPLQEAVIRMENSLQGLQDELKEKNALIEAQQAQMAELQNALEHMRGNMDKLAAEAAAKVIREELAALLREEA